MPDGAAIAYACGADLCRVSATGSGRPERLVGDDYSETPQSWSPDGRVLLYINSTPTGRDLWAWESGRMPAEVLVTPFSESGAIFSLNGRYFTYVSDESGRPEVYVRPFRNGDDKWLISTNGGAEPIWSLDGRELFYREGNAMMAVPVTFGPTFKAGAPRRLFERRFDVNDTHLHYGRDRTRFVKVQREEDSGPARLHLILNFTAERAGSQPASLRP